MEGVGSTSRLVLRHWRWARRSRSSSSSARPFQSDLSHCLPQLVRHEHGKDAQDWAEKAQTLHGASRAESLWQFGVGGKGDDGPRAR